MEMGVGVVVFGGLVVCWCGVDGMLDCVIVWVVVGGLVL